MEISRTAREAARPESAVLLAVIAILLSVLQSGASAPAAESGNVPTHSYSGQFVVYAPRSSGFAPPAFGLAASEDLVRLEPSLVTVSCERIRLAMMRELGATAPWRGAICLVLHPVRVRGEAVVITSERFNGCWQYRVDFPEVVERSRYVRAMVQVLLLEMANRTAQEHPAEIPLWLIEGMAQLLSSSSEVELVLAPPRANANGFNFRITTVNERRETLRQQAQKKLHGRAPLTFDNLSWPGGETLSGDGGDLYRGSAQLFVGELLRLPHGRGCLQAMLARLPQYYNWQFAFLSAFGAFFERPLDVEKWWALSVAQATGRDIAPSWTLARSWQRLTEAIHAPVEVRLETNALPLHADIPLQTVIREWDSARQTQALNDTLRKLAILRLRIDQEFVGLVQDYYQALETYLQQREHAGSFVSTKRAGRRRAVEGAIQQLDALDARREAMQPAALAKPPSQTPGRPGPAP